MLSSTLISELADSATYPIQNVLSIGGPRSSAPRDEVSAVRAITLDGFDEIATAWTPILSHHGYSLDLTSVFCHSRPHVLFSRLQLAEPTTVAMATCELADLLIVMDHVDAQRGLNDRRAVLVQAKILKSGRFRLRGREWFQHELLARLPEFTFVDGGYDPRARNLLTDPIIGNPGATAEYAGIDLARGSAGCWYWLPSRDQNLFCAKVDFATYLAGMAVGRNFHGRAADIGGTDDWSFTVDELLRVTAAKPITKANSTVLRGNANVIGFAENVGQMNSTVEDGGDGGIYEGEVPEWPQGAISTVHFVFRSIDEEGRHLR